MRKENYYRYVYSRSQIHLFYLPYLPVTRPIYRHCQDLRAAGDTGVSVRTVYPYDDTTIAVDVLCDQDTAGGGWTIIQQRKYREGVSRVDFFRNWLDYQEAFGNIEPNGEFWMGNNFIHHLTNNLNFKVINCYGI